MEIQETRQGAVTVVRPQGPLALGDAEQFKSVVDDAVRRSLGRVLVDAADALAKTGRALHVCCVNETIREVLHMTGLADRFEHFEDVNSAVRSFL